MEEKRIVEPFMSQVRTIFPKNTLIIYGITIDREPCQIDKKEAFPSTPAKRSRKPTGRSFVLNLYTHVYRKWNVSERQKKLGYAMNHKHRLHIITWDDKESFYMQPHLKTIMDIVALKIVHFYISFQSLDVMSHHLLLNQTSC